MILVECINYDVKQAINIMRGFHSKIDDFHDRLYFNSNEDLDALLSKFDFRDKDILTVLASSDQLFYFYDKGARIVDTFDINKLTFYYYFLRKWIIEYKNRYYPRNKITGKMLNNIISKVCVKSEEEERAVSFWKRIINSYYTNLIMDLFIVDDDIKKNENSNIKTIKKKLKSTNLNFYNMDITGYIDLDKKYDVIYKSNISDYVSYSDLVRFRDNLYKLLKDDGIIISSNLSYDIYYPNEFGVFSELFNYKLLDNDMGFVYTKK